MAEWLRPRAFHCRERTKYTPDKRGFEILFLKRSPQAGRMVLKSRPVVTLAGAKADIYLEDRMAEWLRPRASIAENGLNIRRISVDSILSLKEVHRLDGWC